MDKRFKAWIAYLKVLRASDVIVHVVDARDPAGTFNSKLKRYRSKLIIAVNKRDLVPDSQLNEISPGLKGYRHVFVSGKTGQGIERLREAIKVSLKRGKPKVAVVGYPNVGKSSIMNRLGNRRASKVSPIPGETRGVQWVSADGFMMVDTPGVVPPSEKSGKELVLKSAVAVEKIPSPEPIALEIIQKFLDEKPSSLENSFKIKLNGSEEAEEILEMIAKRRGKLLKGGELNMLETAKLVIRDYQRGKLSMR